MRPTPIPTKPSGKAAAASSTPHPTATSHTAIALVETAVDNAGDGTPRFYVRCALEPGDLERLSAGGHVWVAFYGGLIPFNVDVEGPTESRRSERQPPPSCLSPSV